MRVRWLKTCCRCCDLRDGVTSIGLLHCLVDVLCSLWLAVLVSDGQLVRRLLASEPEISPLPAAGAPGPPPDLQTLTYLLQLSAALLLAVLLLSLPASAALLAAAAGRRRRWLLPWLAWQGLLLALQLLLALAAVLGALASWQRAAEAWYVIGLQLLCLAISAYFYAVVLSFFVQLKEQEGKDYATTPIMT